jgi:hypothetical protein
MNQCVTAFFILYRKGPGDTYVVVGEEDVALSGLENEMATAYRDALEFHGSKDGQYLVQNKTTRSCRTFNVFTERTIKEV